LSVIENPIDSGYDFKEREKELKCLYGISKFMRKSDISNDELLQEMLSLIQSAMRFPHLTCVMININNKLYKTQDYKQTPWIISSNAKESSCEITIEVYNKQNKIFANEKVELINEITFRLKTYLEQNVNENQLEILNETQNKLKESEQRIKEQNTFLTNILVSLTHPFYVVNVSDYSIKLANTAAIKDPPLGPMTCYGLAHRRDDPCKNESPCPIEIVKHTKKPITVEHLHYDIEGNIRNIDVHGFPIIDEDGNVDQVILYSIDITERKKAQEKLKESEEKFSKAFHSSPSLMMIIRMEDGLILDANNAFTQVLGYSREELIGHSSIKLNLWVNSEQRSEIIKRLTEDENIRPFDVDVYTKSGKILTILFSGDICYINKIPHLIISANDITEHRKAEQKVKDSERALRESEKFLKKAQSIAHIGHFKLDPITMEVSGSDELFNIFGLSRDEATLDAFAEVVHPEDREYDLYHIRRGIEFGESWDIEHRLLFKNGTIKGVHAIGEAIKDETGKITLVLGIVQDITEQKKAENLIKEKNEFLTSTIESLTHPFYVINVENHNIDLANSSAFSGLLTNSSKCYEVTHMSDVPCAGEHPCPLDLVKSSKKPCRVEHLHYDENGNSMYVEIYGYPIFDKEGNVKQMIEYSIDISERRRAEKKLRESEEKYRLLFENMNTGFAYHEVVVNEDNKPIDYRYIEVNNQFEKLTGLKVSDIIGKTVTEILPGIENDPVDWIGKYGNVALTGKPLNIEDYSEQLDRWYNVSSYSPKKRFFAITFSDITDRKRAEQLIRDENRKLKELSKMKKDIITRVSHELKTPLTSIHGASYYLLNFYKNDIIKEVLEYLEIIYQGSLRLKYLVNDLIDTSRLEAGKLDLNKTKINIVEIIEDCINALGYFSDNRNLKIEKHVPEQLVIEIDKIRIEQVITNLISNAIKNTPPYGEISIALREDVDNIYIQVKDTGVGITEEEQPFLFEKFGKIERYGQGLGVDIDGSGLGLFISKEIVELHSGDIFFESEGRNKGTIFTVRLPKT